MTLLLLVLGCASGNSCADYVEAVRACVEANDLDPSAYDPDVLCPEWSPEDEATYGEWYTCQAAAYEDVDCTTDGGLLAAEEAAASCAP